MIRNIRFKVLKLMLWLQVKEETTTTSTVVNKMENIIGNTNNTLGQLQHEVQELKRFNQSVQVSNYITFTRL